MAATVGGGCFFQITAQVASTTNSKSNLALQPGLISGPISLSPRLWTRPSLSSRPRRLSASATAGLTLPTAKPERLPSDNLPRWSARSLKSFTLAEVQARHFKRPELSTEVLLLGVLVDGTSEATKYLREIGITLSKVREETYNVIEWDWKYWAPIDIPLSDLAQKALDWAVDYKLKSGEDGEITVGHLVLGIWSEKESNGHKVLATLGFDSKKAKELSKIASNDAALSYR